MLDTTYFLPAIGISVKDLAEVPTALVRSHKLAISEISVFELSAKAARYANDGLLPPERAARGIGAIVHDERIEKIPVYDTELFLTATKVRSMIKDFIDCTIISSAMNHCEWLVTEDDEIANLEQNQRFRNLVEDLNPRFKVLTAKEVLKLTK